MALREEKYQDLNMALQHATHPDETAGDPGKSAISPQYRVIDTPQPTVKADIEERQAVEVRPMRYVLGIGIALAIAAMAVAWIFLHH